MTEDDPMRISRMNEPWAGFGTRGLWTAPSGRRYWMFATDDVQQTPDGRTVLLRVTPSQVRPLWGPVPMRVLVNLLDDRAYIDIGYVVEQGDGAGFGTGLWAVRVPNPESRHGSLEVAGGLRSQTEAVEKLFTRWLAEPKAGPRCPGCGGSACPSGLGTKDEDVRKCPAYPGPLLFGEDGDPDEDVS